MNTEADKGEHNKQVYAYFRLAYSSASVFESALINALLSLDLLAELNRRFKSAATFDRAAYEAAYVAFFAKQQAATLGTLVKRVQSLAEMEAGLKKLVLMALGRRNFLAHRFFWHRAVAFMTSEGPDRMIEELDGDVVLSGEAKQAVDDFAAPYRVKLGISDAMLHSGMSEYYEEQGLVRRPKE